MNALIRRLIIDATPPIEKISARLFKFAALFFVTVSLLFVSATLLAIALFVFVQPFAGTAIAALVTGIIYLGAAGICICVARKARRGTCRRGVRPDDESHIDPSTPKAWVCAEC